MTRRWTPEAEDIIREALCDLRQRVPAEYEKTWARTILTVLAEVGLLVPPTCNHCGWFGLYCARPAGHDGRHAVGKVRWPSGTPEFKATGSLS